MKQMYKKMMKYVPESLRVPFAIQLAALILMGLVLGIQYRMQYHSLQIAMEYTSDNLIHWQNSYDVNAVSGLNGNDILEKLLSSDTMYRVDDHMMHQNSAMVIRLQDPQGETIAETTPRNLFLFLRRYRIAGNMNVVPEVIRNDGKQMHDYNSYDTRAISLDKNFPAEELDRLLKAYEENRSWAGDEGSSRMKFRYLDGFYDKQGQIVPLKLQMADPDTEECVTIYSGEILSEGTSVVRLEQPVFSSDSRYFSAGIDIIEDNEFGEPVSVQVVDCDIVFRYGRTDLYEQSAQRMEEYAWGENTGSYIGLGMGNSFSEWNHDSEDFLIGRGGGELPIPCMYEIAYLVDLKRMAWLSCGWLRSLLMIEILTLVGILLYRRYYREKEELRLARNTFLNAMAHEMKTPAAVIRSSAECISDGVCPEKNPCYLEQIRREADRMSELVNHMLLYTRVGDMDYEKKTEMIPVLPLVLEASESYQALLDSKSMQLVTEVPEDARITGDRSLLLLVLENFLSNAVQFGRRNSTVTVRFQDSILSVHNEGEPVAVEDLPHVWEPLYRGDASRSSSSVSSGMGLAICADILKMHRAEYQIKNETDGVTVSFQLP